MNVSSPRDMSIYISIIASVIAGVTMVVTIGFTGYYALAVIAAILFIFIVVYIVSYYLLSSFIFEKINPIYKTIHNLNISDNELKRELEEKDLISEVNKEVLHWATSKSREIDKLKEMERYRKEFLGNVSHELKTPIFNIQGYVLTLLDGGLDDPSINKQYLEKAEKSIDRMISIVEDLEAISRLEAGEMLLDMDRFNIVTLVDEVFDVHEIRAKSKGITLCFDKEYDKPVWVYADKKRIYQVLANLVVNSINYGKQNGKTVVSFSDMHERILVEVNDDGVGIDKKDIPRIFERFYRVDKSRSREQGGTGLGLAIVKHVIEAHRQTINVRSSVNEGTSFVFTLAKAQSDRGKKG